MRRSVIVLALLLYLSSCGDSALELEREANEFFRNQNYNEAIIKYTQALTKDSSLFTSRFNRGICHYINSDNRKAASDFKSATYLKPTDSLGIGLSYFNLGLSQLALNNANKALNAFDEAKKLNMSSYNLTLQRANCFFKMANYNKASLLYTQALPYFSDSMSIYKSRGISYYQTNRMMAAFIDFETYLSQNSSPSVIYEFAGIAATLIGDYDKAIYYFDQFMENESSLTGDGEEYMVIALVNQSKIDYVQGDINRCVELLGKAISINPRAKSAYLQRGKVFLSLDKYFEACEDLNTAFINGLTEAEDLLKESCPEYY